MFYSVLNLGYHATFFSYLCTCKWIYILNVSYLSKEKIVIVKYNKKKMNVNREIY